MFKTDTVQIIICRTQNRELIDLIICQFIVNILSLMNIVFKLTDVHVS